MTTMTVRAKTGRSRHLTAQTLRLVDWNPGWPLCTGIAYDRWRDDRRLPNGAIGAIDGGTTAGYQTVLTVRQMEGRPPVTKRCYRCDGWRDDRPLPNGGNRQSLDRERL